MGQEVVWRWRGNRWVIGYLVFWLAAGMGAGFMVYSPSFSWLPAEQYIDVIILIYIMIGVLNDKFDKTPLQKSIIEKIGWCVALMFLNFIISSLILILLVSSKVESPEKIAMGMYLMTGSVIIYFAMRRSRYFVEPAV